MQLVVMIICVILILSLVFLILWIEKERGDNSIYGEKTLYDKSLPQSVQVVMDKLKTGKGLDNGFLVLTKLKDMYNLDYGISPYKCKPIDKPLARTTLRNKFLANRYFLENMSIRIYQDCIHEIGHTYDICLIKWYYVMLGVAILSTVATFVLKLYLIMPISAVLWVYAAKISINIERNAIAFAAEKSYTVTKKLGFTKEESNQVYLYLKEKAVYIRTYYKWRIIENISLMVFFLLTAGLLYTIMAFWLNI